MIECLHDRARGDVEANEPTAVECGECSVPSGSGTIPTTAFASVEGAIAEEADVAGERREQCRARPLGSMRYASIASSAARSCRLPRSSSDVLARFDEGRVRLGRRASAAVASAGRRCSSATASLGVSVGGPLRRQCSLLLASAAWSSARLLWTTATSLR